MDVGNVGVVLNEAHDAVNELVAPEYDVKMPDHSNITLAHIIITIQH